jgi:predicted transcriptional regulator
MAGRRAYISDPNFAQSVAELYAVGLSHKAIAEELGVHSDSVSNWVRDPRIQARVHRITLERIQRITRKVDESIEGRLAYVEKMDLKDLLDIRKEFVKSLPQGKTETDASGAASEVAEAMDQDPAFAEELARLVEASSAAKKKE